ncbi:unnamed protein product [Staurois parvus]|uniref:Uncharacterized protein n=1 Tax=Staurois parvus TaxID=386267 RepID=A0ABN9GLU6_9NEOB|nr:unnamed protein product [Staurois parvus]
MIDPGQGSPNFLNKGRNYLWGRGGLWPVGVEKVLMSVAVKNARDWWQWEEYALSLVPVGGIVPVIGISGRKSAPSLVSLGGIEPHHCYQWEE